MKTNVSKLLKSKKAFAVLAALTAFVLLIPLVAMQFTDDVDWGLSDFIIMGLLMFSLGSLFILVARRMPERILIIGAVFLLVLIYIWAELSVGIFTDLGS